MSFSMANKGIMGSRQFGDYPLQEAISKNIRVLKEIFKISPPIKNNFSSNCNYIYYVISYFDICSILKI